MQMNYNASLPPARELWGDVESDSDRSSAMEIFLGKTNEDIIPLLEYNYFIRCLDLRVMPDPVFEYYGVGFAEFILRSPSDDERFGVLLGAFLDAASCRREYSPSIWLNFWRQPSSLLKRFSDRLDASEINEEAKSELIEELGKIRSAILEA